MRAGVANLHRRGVRTQRQLAAFLVFTAVSALGGRLALWFNSSPRGQMLMHRVAGLVFVVLAVMLVVSWLA